MQNVLAGLTEDQRNTIREAAMNATKEAKENGEKTKQDKELARLDDEAWRKRQDRRNELQTQKWKEAEEKRIQSGGVPKKTRVVPKFRRRNVEERTKKEEEGETLLRSRGRWRQPWPKHKVAPKGSSQQVIDGIKLFNAKAKRDRYANAKSKEALDAFIIIHLQVMSLFYGFAPAICASLVLPTVLVVCLLSSFLIQPISVMLSATPRKLSKRLLRRSISCLPLLIRSTVT